MPKDKINPLDEYSKEIIKDERPVLSATSVPTYMYIIYPRGNLKYYTSLLPKTIVMLSNNIVTSKTSKKEKHSRPLKKMTIKLSVRKINKNMNSLLVQCVFIHVLMTAVIIECW